MMSRECEEDRRGAHSRGSPSAAAGPGWGALVPLLLFLTLLPVASALPLRLGSGAWASPLPGGPGPGPLPSEERDLTPDVPLRVEHGWFIVPVLVDDSVALDFIVDTGAGLSAVSRTALERLGRTADRRVRAQGASGAQELPVTRLGSLTLPGFRSFNPRVVVLDDGVLTPRVPGGATAYDGVLGADVLATHDVLLDPVQGVLRLFGGDGPRAAELPPLAEPLPLWRIAGPIVAHDVEVNGSVMPAILDTGSRRVVVSPRGARNARAEPLPGTERSGRSGVGTTNVSWQDVDLERLRAGTTDLGAVAAQVGDLPVFRSLGLGDRAVLLLGNPALRHCPVLISYRKDTIRYCRELRPG